VDNAIACTWVPMLLRVPFRTLLPLRQVKRRGVWPAPRSGMEAAAIYHHGNMCFGARHELCSA